MQKRNGTIQYFSMDTFLGIDWGGTFTKLGLIDKDGKIIKKTSFSSLNSSQPDDFIKKISDNIKKYKNYNIKGIGVGAPGIINVEKGYIYYLPNIKGWENYPFKQVLEKRLSLPVFLDNDANIFALAEFQVGAAKGVKNAIFLTLGTGLGGALIIDGKIFHSKTSAAELAHFPVVKKGRKCGCGANGCIETFVGNRYIERKYKMKKRLSKEVSVKEIFKFAADNDKIAREIINEFVWYLGRYLAGMVNIFNPEKIIIGGGVSKSLHRFKKQLWDHIKNQAMEPNCKGTKIVKAKLGNWAGVIGAGLLVKEKLGR